MTIPENTDVLVPLYLVNRDPTLWLHPSKFMPERLIFIISFLIINNSNNNIFLLT